MKFKDFLNTEELKLIKDEITYTSYWERDETYKRVVEKLDLIINTNFLRSSHFEYQFKEYEQEVMLDCLADGIWRMKDIDDGMDEKCEKLKNIRKKLINYPEYRDEDKKQRNVYYINGIEVPDLEGYYLYNDPVDNKRKIVCCCKFNHAFIKELVAIKVTENTERCGKRVEIKTKNLVDNTGNK